MASETFFAQVFLNSASTPHFGFTIAQDRVGWFHASPAGNPVYRSRYKTVEHFQPGKSGQLLAWVRKDDGTYIAIDEQNQEVRFEHALPF